MFGILPVTQMDRESGNSILIIRFQRFDLLQNLVN